MVALGLDIALRRQMGLGLAANKFLKSSSKLNCSKIKFYLPLSTYFDNEKVVPSKLNLHRPGQNYDAKNYIITKNTTCLLKEHVKITGGKVRTRFPPEPNGLLHLGHAKAISLSFGYAKAHDGICFLRFDDSNPETAEEIFSYKIQEALKWLGVTPYKVTYTSDYFPQLYEWAKQLIKKNLAFVCHDPPNTNFQKYRDTISPWRNRSVVDSLYYFEEMKSRKFNDGEATLRLKMTTEQKTVDPIIYRIKNHSHHRTKDQWCIYPTYDFAHCLCDSIEHITHSMCSAEFTMRRSTYYWICNALDIYCPVQIEFGKLHFLYTVVSKRKIIKLLEAGLVKGWDDPRLFTLDALKRRGFPPEAINTFCEDLGFNQSSIYVDPKHLHFHVREFLNKNAIRRMAVLNPLKVIITNFPYIEPLQIKVDNYPKDPARGNRSIVFEKILWIEQGDFKENDEKGFRRLTPTQSVGLKHSSHVLIFQELVRFSDGRIDHLKASCVPLKNISKPKAFIHWVCNPIEAEVRLYENLFYHDKPDDLDVVPGGFLSDVNPNSMKVVSALVERSLVEADPLDKFQFERIAYFSIDPDTTSEKIVFNKIVDLKQDKGFKSS